jgi:hypothetical protein
MAVNVNTVYQTVLYILNKEQRGYAPPAEFNSIAGQVQLEIFNSYFPDGNQVNRANQNNTQNDTEYFNIFENLSYKLTPFIQEIEFNIQLNNTSFAYPLLDPVTGAFNSEVYIIGEVICTYNGNPIINSAAQRVSKKEYTIIEKSKLTKPTSRYPIYYNYGYEKPYQTGQNSSYIIVPSPVPDSLTASVIKTPESPVWGFISGGQGQYIYSQSASIDFSLDISEQTNLVTNILKYFGIVINDPTIIQTAAQEAAKVEANEKS